MGFDGVHRASVGLQVPGAGILLLLSWERVNSGAATSTITKLRLSFIIDRSCAASIGSFWCGSVTTTDALVQNIGPNHLYGWVIPSVVDVIDLDGIRARVGATVPSPPESVHPGVTTFYFHFIDHGRRFVDFERSPRDA